MSSLTGFLLRGKTGGAHFPIAMLFPTEIHDMKPHTGFLSVGRLYISIDMNALTGNVPSFGEIPSP
jgi:hypothetical protein